MVNIGILTNFLASVGLVGSGNSNIGVDTSGITNFLAGLFGEGYELGQKIVFFIGIGLVVAALVIMAFNIYSYMKASKAGEDITKQKKVFTTCFWGIIGAIVFTALFVSADKWLPMLFPAMNEG